MSYLNDYESYDALALAELIRTKKTTPKELLATAIQATEKYNPQLNAIVSTMYDEALEQIKHLDYNAPFAGVPFLLKDLGLFYKGTITTQGSRLYRDFVSDFDSDYVARLKRAGFIIFGKTNIPEFGMSFSTEPLLFGPCRNPWDLSRTPGGSSGGAASAVAARIVPAAAASDGGGSIRVPASCCGLFGLKPTRARVPVGPLLGEGWGGCVVKHAITITVRDSAAILDALCGPELGDPYYAPYQAQPFLKMIEQPLQPLRIAYTTTSVRGVAVDQTCKAAVLDAVQLCQSLGHQLVETEPKFNVNAMAEAFHVIVSTNAQLALSLREKELGRTATIDEIEPISKLLISHGKKVKGVDYVDALNIMHYESRQIAAFFQDNDMLLTPTLAKPPVPIGEFDIPPERVSEYYEKSLAFGPFTAFWNQTGQPAMSIPLYWSPENLPIGVQFVGQFGDENRLLQLATQLEKIRPWRDKKPPLLINT